MLIYIRLYSRRITNTLLLRSVNIHGACNLGKIAGIYLEQWYLFAVTVKLLI